MSTNLALDLSPKTLCTRKCHLRRPTDNEKYRLLVETSVFITTTQRRGTYVKLHIFGKMCNFLPL